MIILLENVRISIYTLTIVLQFKMRMLAAHAHGVDERNKKKIMEIA